MEGMMGEKHRASRLERLESQDQEVFKQAYKELEESVRYAKKEFGNTQIYSCLKRALENYALRYEGLNTILQSS